MKAFNKQSTTAMKAKPFFFFFCLFLVLTMNVKQIIKHRTLIWGVSSLLIWHWASWGLCMIAHNQQTWLELRRCRPSTAQLQPTKLSLSHIPNVTHAWAGNTSDQSERNSYEGLMWLSTLSSIVSNLVSNIPSISRGFDVVERSANFCNNRHY